MSTRNSYPHSLADAQRYTTLTAKQAVSCRVCGRTLLMGEKSVEFYTQTSEDAVDVCELCAQNAHRYGLSPHPVCSETLENARAGNRLKRRIRQLTKNLGKREYAPKAPQDGMVVAQARPQRSVLSRLAHGAQSEPVSLTSMPVGEAVIPLAIKAFNQSAHARTLAGLYRTLGEPKVSVVPRTSTDRETIITVAWEIVWYQYRVMPDGIEQQSGQYLSELANRWQNWNYDVNSRGLICEKSEKID